jgi:putative FmdB family regulatory protein
VPVYQYACTECGEQLEVRQSFTDAALTECPACAGRLRKVLNAVGVVFKGSGFYRTDSRAPAKSGAGSSDTSSPAKTDDAKPAKTGDAKPATTTDSGAKPAAAATH